MIVSVEDLISSVLSTGSFFPGFGVTVIAAHVLLCCQNATIACYLQCVYARVTGVLSLFVSAAVTHTTASVTPPSLTLCLILPGRLQLPGHQHVLLHKLCAVHVDREGGSARFARISSVLRLVGGHTFLIVIILGNVFLVLLEVG